MNLDTLFREHSERTDEVLDDLQVPAFVAVRQHRRVARNRVAVAAAGAVAIIAAVVLLVPRPADIPFTEDTPTTTAAVTTTTPSSTTGPVPDDPTEIELIATQWTSHKLGTDLLAVIGAGSPSYVDSGGFFIAGTYWTRGNDWFRGRLWRSSNGTDWSVVPGSGTVFPERVELVEVIGGDDRLLAWGGGAMVDPTTTIWVSQDGWTWTVAAQVATAEPRHGLVLESGGYLLYGGGLFDPEGFTGNPEVLLSSDGVSWEVVPAPAAFTAIVQLDSGQVIATGGPAAEPMTWTSADGRAWTLLSADHATTDGAGAAVNALVAAGPGLVAAGTNSAGEAAFWVSTDGRSFDQVASFEPNGPQGGWPDMEEPPTVDAIAAGPEWLVAVGHYGVGGDQARGIGGGAIWISRDGIGWDPVPVELLDRRATGLSGVAYGDATFVATGDRGEEPLILSWTPSS
jgi:hypothetical protein